MFKIFFSKFKTQNSFGFTLIELLVVISIISLLASVILVSLNKARSKSRDSKRISDLRQLQGAMELYFNENNQYPQTDAISTPGSGWSGAWATLLPSANIITMPKDPLNIATQYGYYYSMNQQPTGKCTYSAITMVNVYILATRLEDTASSPNSCTSGGFGNGGWDLTSNVLNYLVGKSP